MKAATWFVLAACLTTGALWQTVDVRPRSACDKGYVNQEGACEDEPYDRAAPEGVAEAEGATEGVPSSSFQAMRVAPGMFNKARVGHFFVVRTVRKLEILEGAETFISEKGASNMHSKT